MKKFKKIYIAGALTHAGNKQKEIYEEIADLCREFCNDVYVPHLGGTDPVKNPEVTAFDVWQKNFKIVSESDLLIVYAGEPSLGVGAELEIARIAGNKIILWWFKGEKVSRMARGNPAVVKMIEAESLEDLNKKIKTAVRNMT
jgi:hypothetical protein